MFPKAALTFLAIGALYVNALAVPVARSPAPEPDCGFSRSFSTTFHRDSDLYLLQQLRRNGTRPSQRPKSSRPESFP